MEKKTETHKRGYTANMIRFASIFVPSKKLTAAVKGKVRRELIWLGETYPIHTRPNIVSRLEHGYK